MASLLSRRNFLTASTLALATGNTFAQEGLMPKAIKPMRITGLEAIWLSTPLKERFWMSLTPIGGYHPKATRLILKIHTDAGITGYGEGGGGVELLKRGFQDLIIGEDPFMVEWIWDKMFKTTVSRESAVKGWDKGQTLSLMAAIDAGLWDIMAKVAGVPLYKLLGGYKNQVPVYVTGGYYREGKGVNELVEEIEGYVKQGFNAVKLKIGGVGVDEDVQRVRAVRKAVGDKIKIMLDVNQAWDVATTIEASKKLYELDITWLEEPLQWYDDVHSLARVKKDVRIPLASGEHEITRFGARTLMETGAIDFMQFDCHKSAGITEWKKIAGMASMYHIWMAPHHEPQLHGHLLASIPNGYILESFANPDRDPFWFEIYSRKPKIENSILILSDEPGIGVEFDAKALEKYGTKIV
jgi:L-alanine-DL-glutamate epimerase-like enolase superfamily enzyme